MDRGRAMDRGGWAGGPSGEGPGAEGPGPCVLGLLAGEAGGLRGQAAALCAVAAARGAARAGLAVVPARTPGLLEVPVTADWPAALAAFGLGARELARAPAAAPAQGLEAALKRARLVLRRERGLPGAAEAPLELIVFAAAWGDVDAAEVGAGLRALDVSVVVVHLDFLGAPPGRASPLAGAQAGRRWAAALAGRPGEAAWAADRRRWAAVRVQDPAAVARGVAKSFDATCADLDVACTRWYDKGFDQTVGEVRAGRGAGSPVGRTGSFGARSD